MSDESKTLAYYEDYKLRQNFRSRAYLLSQSEIIKFAKKWDPMPFHIDPEYARTTHFGGVVASGLHLLDICHKLVMEAVPAPAAIAGLQFDEVRFHSPGRPGDRFVCEGLIVAKRPSKSRDDAGILRFGWGLINGRNEQALTYKVTIMVYRRPLMH